MTSPMLLVTHWRRTCKENRRRRKHLKSEMRWGIHQPMKLLNMMMTLRTRINAWSWKNRLWVVMMMYRTVTVMSLF